MDNLINALSVDKYPEPYQTSECRSPGIPESLLMKKRSLEKSLAEVNEALEALEKNPEITKVLHLLVKASRG